MWPRARVDEWLFPLTRASATRRFDESPVMAWPAPDDATSCCWSILRCHPIGSDLPGSHGADGLRQERGASFTPIPKTVRKGDSGADRRALSEEGCQLARHYRKVYLSVLKA